MLTYVFIAFECLPGSKIAVPQGNSMFNLLRLTHSVFRSGRIILHSHHRCMKGLISDCFYHSSLPRYEAMSCGDFDLHSLCGEGCGHLGRCLLGICISALKKYLTGSLGIFSSNCDIGRQHTKVRI